MSADVTYKIKGWESHGEGWIVFLTRTFLETFRRIHESIALDWFKEQFHLFHLRRDESQHLHKKVVTPIKKALQLSGMADEFHSREAIEIALQISESQVLTLVKNGKSSEMTAAFTFKAGSTFRTFHLKFEDAFGDIISTHVTYHYGSIAGGRFGGKGLIFPEIMFTHIADLLLCKPVIKNVKVLRIEIG